VHSSNEKRQKGGEAENGGRDYTGGGQKVTTDLSQTPLRGYNQGGWKGIIQNHHRTVKKSRSGSEEEDKPGKTRLTLLNHR